MGLRLGPIDPLQLIFEILNKLIDKKQLSVSEARAIIKLSLDPKMSDEDKEKFMDLLMGKKDGK